MPAFALTPFDASLARYATRLLPLDRVVDLLTVVHAPERVAEYATAMRAGARFPPVAVVRLAGRFIVADGHKRLAAFRQVGGSEILVEVWPWRRWLRDQWRQAVEHTRKNREIVSLVFTDPVQAARLARTTVDHWVRVARSLLSHLTPRPGSHAMPLVRRVLTDAWGLRGPLSLAALSIAGLGAAQLYLTWLLKRWAESPAARREAAFDSLAVEGAVVVLAGAAALFVSRYATAVANQRYVEQLRNRAAARLMAQQVPAIRAARTGDYLTRVLHDAGTLSAILGALLRRCVRESVVAIGGVWALFLIDWRLAAISAVVVPLAVLLGNRFGALIRRAAGHAHGGAGALGALLDEQLQGFTTVKAFQAEARELQRFSDLSARVRHDLVRSEAWSAALVGCVFLATGATLLLVIRIGSAQLAGGALTDASLLAFCLFGGQALESVRRLTEQHAMLQASLAAAARVYDAISLPHVERVGGPSLPPRIDGGVTFTRVAFTYDGRTPALRDVTLGLRPRDQLALVGPSGSGKSTLGRLLVGFYTPSHGAIRLDQHDVTTVALADLRRAVCLVEQDTFLFSGTLGRNIAYGNPGAAADDVREAARSAGLEPLLARLPRGLDTTLAEAGRQLSGGEKQRIALARAILRDPAVLLLDEATNALDGEIESALFSRLGEWLRARTVISIGHRLSTVCRFRRAVLLIDGRIAADGAPARLIRDCPRFARLFADQLEPVSTAASARTSLASRETRRSRLKISAT
jgi:ABC-type multidrug transport system fused ATPase/permease subunit